jgi:DNA invertase Pin-like site-specific DNA recombinase
MTTQPASPTAYSYVRFSSKKQEEGDSIRRQLELTSAWAKRNKVHLDTSLQPDRGISAFRGKNRDLGALGAFLRLVEKDVVPPGSFLVVESLDRVTREEIQPALLLVLSLLQKGVKVVQLKPVETVYDKNSDTTPIILMLVELSRGHSESKVKSFRVSEAWGKRRDAARAGKGVFTRKLPLWVEDRGGGLVAIPERAEVVRKIFEWSAAGTGLHAIMTRLTAEGVPAFGSSGRWSVAYVDKILADRRAVGEFQPRLRGGKPDGPPIVGYFPTVVTEEQWHRARVAARGRHRPYTGPEKGRSSGGRIGARVNLFQGLVKSARDGFSFTVVSKSPKNPNALLRSAGYRLGAGRAESFPLEVFEKAVLSRLREIDPHEVLNGDTRDESLDLAGRLKDVEVQLAKIEAELVNLGGDVPAAVRAMDVLEGQRKELAKKLAEARQKAAHPLSESWGEAKSLLAALEAAPDEREARLRLREAIRRIVEEVRVLVVARGKDRYAAVQIWFAGAVHGVRHRDYVIHHRGGVVAGHGGVIRRPATWAVEDFGETGVTALDLRKPADVARLEKQLRAALEA